MVADLKARLSEYLREVASGRPILVVSRDHPVAVLTPYQTGAGEPRVRHPLPEAPAPCLSSLDRLRLRAGLGATHDRVLALAARGFGLRVPT